ncbi:hypothetical protein F0562_004536 [Nyssa sinensis]|uniref:DUF7950 domain-containing protein n=1 Tax=Nyssa sinensis TaxID=561372 RepID=A0A5J5BYD8_9ASTE|nr:hypothetical protein F0562_004536 [Nyssa sinensis]
MDTGNGCFSTRCAGGAYDKTIINRMMLRFRPIAPKPVTGGSVSCDSPPENKNSYLTNTRAKRKLLPEKTDNGQGSMAGQSWRNIDRTLPIWLNMINNSRNSEVTVYSESDRMATMPVRRVVESWVTVECLTDTYIDGGRMGSTDFERIKSLEVDTCPGFISDGLNRVKWVNQAYKRMVGPQDDGESQPEVVVRLVVKEELPILHAEFACRVRVQSTWQQQMNSQTMPCDVWRIDLVGLAWRLDIRAALSLGR